MRIVYALLLAVLFCIGPAIQLIRSGGTDPAALSDWDESYYLPLLREGASVPVVDLVRIKSGTLAVYDKLDTRIPHRVVDVFLGNVWEAIGMSLPAFGLLLDFVCIVVSFLILYSTLSLLTNDSLECASTAVTVLFLPWLFSTFIHAVGPPSLGTSISTIANRYFPSTAVLRGVYTQISYPVFLFGLYCLLRVASSPGAGRRWCIGAGIAAGFSAYLYFFSWLSLSCLALVLIVTLFVSNQASFRRTFVAAIAFLIPFTIVSSAALILLFLEGEVYTPGPVFERAIEDSPRFFGALWYLNPLEVIVALLLLFECRSTKDDRKRLISGMLVALLFSKLLLVNLQPALERWITPYHFPLFYLEPIVTGLLILWAYSLFQERSLRRLLAIVLTFGALVSPVRKIVQIASTSTPTEDMELIAYLQQDTSPRSIATMPFSNPFASGARLQYLLLPFWIKTFTDHNSISQLMSFSADRQSLLRIEYLLGWLYTGEVRLVASCPETLAEIQRGDLLTGAAAYHDWQRYFDCELARSFRPPECELLRSTKVDRVIVTDPEWDLAPRGYFSAIWSSTGRSYQVFRFDYDTALKNACD